MSKADRNCGFLKLSLITPASLVGCIETNFDALTKYKIKNDTETYIILRWYGDTPATLQNLPMKKKYKHGKFIEWLHKKREPEEIA